MKTKDKRLCLRILSILILSCMVITVLSPIIILIEEPWYKPKPIVKVEACEIESFSVETPAPTEKVIYEPTPEPTVSPTPTIMPTPEPTVKPSEFSKRDIALLERVTMSESGNQPFETKVAVAQTIINRLHSGNHGNSIHDIVYAKYQYSTADNGDPNDEVISAVKEAITNTPYPSDMIYFRQHHYHIWAKNYKKFGDLYFSLEP